jgi:DNA-directed RNA polymerase subunit RPC12/RpoP
MASSPGLLLATARTGQGVFLTTRDVDAARAMITDILRRPTAAGATLDMAKLRELLGQLEDAGKPCGRDTAPIIVSAKGQRLLRIIAAQAAIRRELPLKIVYRCADCGNPNISDPEYEASKHQREEVRFIIAMINALLGSVPDSEGQEERICSKCKGRNFDPPILATFCRKCHELRDENVLVKCPDCGFDFLSLERRTFGKG